MAALAMFLATGPLSAPASAEDVESAVPASTGGDRVQENAFTKKQGRLNIAGWTLVGAGVAFPVVMGIVRATKDTSAKCPDPIECPVWPISITAFVLGPVMAATGGALLLRRRKLQKNHERRQGVSISPGLTGLIIAGRF